MDRIRPGWIGYVWVACLVAAMLIQETEHVHTPDRTAEITEAVAVLHGLAKWRIDLELEFFSGILRRSRARERENSGSDDRPDSERREIERPERPFEMAFARCENLGVDRIA